MRLGLGIGLKTSKSRSWITQYKSLCDFFWVEGKLSATELLDQSGNNNHVTITGKDFVTDYIPATSSAKFDCPNNATFVANDTDNLWINKNEQSRGVEVSELIGYDFARTVVWYDNDAPHHIRAIMILKSTVTLTAAQINKMHTDFQLSMFWSGVLNVNGFTKANRGLAQNVWTAVSADALDYSDTYQTAVLADGGEIISRKALESEYQRLIDTGDIASCWFAYHYQTGMKKAVVNYGGTDYTVVSKWYNLSPVAGRFAASITAYQDATYDCRPEFTANGLRFRTAALNGTDRCSLQSDNSVLTNNNNIIKIEGVVIPATLNVYSWVSKGTTTANTGVLSVGEGSGANEKHLGVRHSSGAALPVALSSVPILTYGSEIEIEVVTNFTTAVMTAKADGDSLTMVTVSATPVYPTVNLPDVIGAQSTTGRFPFNGHIKRVALYTL